MAFGTSSFGSVFRSASPSYGSSGTSGLTKKQILDELAPVPEWDQDEQDSLTSWAAREGIGAVGAFGNLLDYFGAGVRAGLKGRNPFAHVSTPMSGEGKTTGRELLTDWNLTAPNKETGLRPWKIGTSDFDPGEALSDVAGLATEIFTDPLTYTGLGVFGKASRAVSTLSKSGRGLHKLGLMDEAADIASRKFGRHVGPRQARRELTTQDFLDDFDNLKNKYPELKRSDFADLPTDQRLGAGMSLNIPFTEATLPLSPTGGRLSRALDWGTEGVGRSAIGRHLTQAFDWSVRNMSGKTEQAMARRLSRFMDNKKNYAAKPLHRFYDSKSEAHKAFKESFGDDIASMTVGGTPTSGGHVVGDVVDHVDLPGKGRVIGQDQRTGELIVTTFDQELGRFRNHTIDAANATTLGKAGTDVANEQLDLLVDKAHDSVWRLAVELDGPGVKTAFKKWDFGDVVDEFEGQKLDFSKLSATQRGSINDSFRETIDALEDVRSVLWEDNLKKGLNAGEMGEKILPNGTPLRHFPRYINKESLDRVREMRHAKGTSARKSTLEVGAEEDFISREFSTQGGSARGRTAATRHMPTAIVNRLYRDKAIGQLTTPDEVARYIRNHKEYSKYLSADWNEAAMGATSIKEHSKALAEIALRNRGDSMYSATMIEDLMKYNDEWIRTNATLDAVHETLARDLITSGGAASQPGGRALADVLEQAGMKVSYDDKLGLWKGAGLEHLAKVMKIGSDPQEISKLASRRVTPEVANAITATKLIRTPSQEMSGFLKVYDRWLNYFKSNVTLPFASFFMRNFASGTFVNLTSGDILNPADIARYMSAFKQADVLSKEAASHPELLREIHSLGFVGGKSHFDDIEKLGRHLAVNDPFAAAPGGSMLELGGGVLNPWSKHWKGTAAETREYLKQNPSVMKAFAAAEQVPGKGMIGVNGMRKLHRNWLSTGSRINSGVEWMNRVPMYLYLKKKGYSPSAAARRVKELQFDYSELAAFEKGWMKRAMPFYTFQRKMGPLFFATIMEKPGGALAQFIKASSRAASPEHILPEYVTQNLAIPDPFAKEGEEGASYITGFGLAHEDPMSYMADLASLGRGDFMEFGRGAGREAASRLNPILKLPIEMLTGQSLYQKGPGGWGRDITTMDPPIGRTVSNVGATLGLLPEDAEPWRWGEQLGDAIGAPTFGRKLGQFGEHLFAATPLSRYATTLKGITDPRPEKGPLDKTLNAFTGIKARAFTPRQLDAIARETLADLAREGDYGREYTAPYIDRQGLIEALAAGRITEEQFNRRLQIAARYKQIKAAQKERAGEQDLDSLLEARNQLL